MLSRQRDVLRLFKGEYLFYTVISLFILIFILITLLNYNLTLMDPEIVVDIPKVLSNGNNFKYEDLFRSLDTRLFDFGGSKTRFLSYLFSILNIKFRIWLLRFFPLPASLSLVWIFIFILSPFFLFRLIFSFMHNSFTSWIAVLLFLVSPGCLFGGTYLFHLAKPLTLFFTIVCLYLASRVNLSLQERDSFSRKDTVTFALLLFTIFLGFFADETAFFIPIYVRILFPDIFKRRQGSFFLTTSYYSVIILFILIITFIVPNLIKHFGFFPFDFWKFIMGETPSIPSPDSYTNFTLAEGGRPFTWLFKLKFTNFLLNGFFLLSNHLNPLRTPTTRNFFKVDIYFFILFLSYLFLLYTKLSKEEKILFKRLSAVLALFVIFHTLLHLRLLVIIPDTYYYGSLFSVFFVIWLSVLLSNKEGFLKYLNRFIFIFFILIFISNFYSTTRKINYGLTDRYKGWFLKETEQMPVNKAFTFSMAYEAWRNRNNRHILAELKNQFPARSYWLFVELDYLTK